MSDSDIKPSANAKTPGSWQQLNMVHKAKINNNSEDASFECEVNRGFFPEVEKWMLHDSSLDASLKCKVNEGFQRDVGDLTLQQCHGQISHDDISSSETRVDKTTVSPNTSDMSSSEARREPIQMTCSNPGFRKKILQTVLPLWSLTCMGWLYGQMGPTFPDLQDLADVPLKYGSWMFSGFSMGYLAGCLIGGFVLSRFSANLLSLIFTLLGAISVALVPWIPVFPVMVALRIITGFGFGGQDTGNISMVFKIWGNKVGPFNQMIYVLFSLGGVASPLATKPFLKKVPMGDTKVLNNTNTTIIMLKNSTQDSISDLINNANESTRVHYAILITGLLYITVAFPFFIAYLNERPAKVLCETKNKKEDISKKKELPTQIERVILFLMLIISFFGTAFFDLLPNFLTTFLINQLQWTQQDGSTLTSLFFVMMCIGTFLNIFGSVYISSTKILLFSLIGGVAFFSGFLLSVIFNQQLFVWASVSLAGLTSANVLPVLFVWIQENVTEVSSSVTSALLIAGSLGVTLNPLLMGFLMDEYSQLWFIYLSLCNITMCLFIFLVAMLLVKLFKLDCKDFGIETEIDQNTSGEKTIEITRF